MAKHKRIATTVMLVVLLFLVSSLAGLAAPAGLKSTVSPLRRDQTQLLQTQPISPTDTLVEVFITDEGIFPPVLDIPSGTTIEWTNQTSQTQRLAGSLVAGEPDIQTIYLPLILKNTDIQSNNTASGQAEAGANSTAGQETIWQSGEILPGESFSRTFDQSGEYGYNLAASPVTTGTIIIETQSSSGDTAILLVTSTADDRLDNDNCTLREAIIAANSDQAVDACPAGKKYDTILLDAATYALTVKGQDEDAAFKGDLDIKRKITLVGADDGQTIIDAAELSDRVFHVLDYGKLTASNVTIINGKGYGGGIYNRGTLTLTDSTLRDNSTGDGGGGLKNDGYATVNSSTISDNTADDGGGIFNRGTLYLNNSTVSGNTAEHGGGIKNQGTLKLNSSTVSDNTAHDGGGVLNSRYGQVKFQQTIIAGNTADERKDADCDDFDYGSLGYNLLGKNTGCPSADTDLKVEPEQIFAIVLGPLQDNGGPTFTHALLSGSPAIDAVPADKCRFSTDQRGVSRPQGAACDIGSVEFDDVHIFIVNTAQDSDDGKCTTTHCTLREAINAANTHPNGSVLDEIHFDIPEHDPKIIQPISALPVVTGPVIIDGITQPGASCDPANLLIELNGINAGLATDGLNISGGDSTIRGLVISAFSGDGIELNTNGNNIIRCNTITANGGDGVRVAGSTGNTIGGTGLPGDVNRIFNNTGLGIDLAGDTVTLNDAGDPDVGANNLQNFPTVTAAFPATGSTLVEGLLNSTAGMTYTLEFFANPASACDPSGFGEGQTFLGSLPVTTDASGDFIFMGVSFPIAIPEGQFVTATATDAQGNTSEFSQCTPVGQGNDSWPTALRLNPGGGSVTVDQFIDKQYQSRWYKFTVQPNSQVIVTLTGVPPEVNLPANYDLTLYEDIQAAFDEFTSPEVEDLVRLNAEFATDVFAADAIARGARSPDAIARGARSPDAFATTAFSPDAIARGARSPDDIARGARSPDAIAPDAFAPDAYTPDALARGARSPDAIARGARSPEAFSSAQIRSLIGISAFEGTAGEGLIANTWNNTGDFYIRVKGRNGAFSLAAPFRLEVRLITGVCGPVSDSLPATTLTASGSSFNTIILTDLARLEGTPAEIATLQARLAAFAARPEVAGVIVDVGADARVGAANTQADNNVACPYAKNLVAAAIKSIVDRYRAQNPLQYIVIIGNDDVIPFFRYPDQALLGPESDYVPPVFSFTASEASLRLDYVLGQDEYGSQTDLSLQVSTVPIPDLAVGRVVETATDVIRMVEAYLATPGGVVADPTSALVTGYDFFGDAAEEIRTQLELGIGLGPGDADALITARDVSPQDPSAWTAVQLRTQLLGSRHDVVFLGGHFSAGSALAADYETRLLSSELASSPVNLENALIFSIGCHSGYNIVNAHGIPGVTPEPDWAQAFAQKGATLIAGTGYQYGDTDFLEYSERIYLEFSRQLRTGSGPVAIGQALVTAKQNYLNQTPQLRALHQKSLLEATLFGFPMLSINMPGARLTPGNDSSIVGGVTDFTIDPGLTLGLKYADVGITPAIVQTTVQLRAIEDNATVETIYLQGSDGVVTNPDEPALPLELNNVTGPGTLVLRGVGFRGGNYSDTPNVNALVGAPTTEIRSIHLPFRSDIFYPVKFWNANYFEALANGGGATRLAVTPAQFKSTTPASDSNTLRQFSSLDFRLYYSDNTASFGADGTPALVAAPVIARVSAPVSGGQANFKITVIGAPVAGIQEVWVTFTTICPANTACNRTWQSIDLTQNPADSTLWEGILNLGGGDPEDFRYMVQAVNGVGLVSIATNMGAYYIPGVEAGDLQPTALLLDPPGSSSGPYGSEATFSAVLTNEGGQPLAGRAVIFGLGAQGDVGVTDGNGRATVTLPLLNLPGQYEVRAAFAGTTTDAASSAPNTFQFTITKQNTVLCLEPPSASNDEPCDEPPSLSFSGFASDASLVVATLTDALAQRLFEKTLVFVVTGSGGSHSESVITDYTGRASLGNLPLPPGNYTLNVYFNGQINLSTGETITLDDARYNPVVKSASLTLQNTPPVALDDAYEVDEDQVLTVAAPGVLANDSDLDNMPLTAVLTTGPGQAKSFTLNADGSFTYIPKPDFYGADTFTYQANDGDLDSNIATVTITVKPVNDAPVAKDDVYSVKQEEKLIVNAPGVLGNDTDIDSVALTAVLVSQPKHGSLTLQADGAFTYIPDHKFKGTDTFTYKANDGSLDSNVAKVTITVEPKLLDCSTAEPYPDILWPPNNKFKEIKIRDVGDEDSKVTIKITSIFQDELVGKSPHSPDGYGVGRSTAWVRAERDGAGDGRVYHISFDATDKQGGFCSGEVRVAVPHDQSDEVDLDAIDGGALYDSTKK